MKRYRTTQDNAQTLAQTIARSLKGGEVIGLIGALGAGKTTFTKYLGTALGVRRTITSPTFTLEQVYATKLVDKKTKQPVQLHHLDMYRVESEQDATHTGLEEFMGKSDAITIIEWADSIPGLLPKNSILIEFI
jgi:tRNA threonylcarbamoyladenosine biosynthesis protein TsaE